MHMKTGENIEFPFIQHRYVRMSVTGLRLIHRGKQSSQNSVWLLSRKIHSSLANFEEISSRIGQYGPVCPLNIVF